jgi:serine/threonine protein kinase
MNKNKVETFDGTIYTVSEDIGKGSYGKVQKLKKKNSNKLYAMKTIEYHDNEITHDIIREIDTLKRTPLHPNLVYIKGLLVTPNFIKILQPYCGKNLKQYIQVTSRQNLIENADTVFSQILQGLHCLHSNGVLHRDIKPQNILIQDYDGNVQIKICDFGLSKVHVISNNTPKVCSLIYRAPELILNYKKYTFSIDIWAFGCVMYEYLCKSVLFRESDKNAMYKKIKANFGSNNKKLSPVLKKIEYPYNSLLSKYIFQINPKKRFAAIEIADYLGYNFDHGDSRFICKRMDNCRDYFSEYPVNSTDRMKRKRKQLFVWMKDIAKSEQMDCETLFLSYSIFDRYYSVAESKFESTSEPVSIASMRIASKFLEIYPCEFIDLDLTDAYREYIQKWEKKILCALDWIVYTDSYYKLLKKHIPNRSRCKLLATNMYMNHNICKQSNKQINKTLQSFFSEKK